MFSNSYYPKQSGRAVVTVHFLNQDIHLHEKNIVSPTGKDRRFSMKMMPAPGFETRLQPGLTFLFPHTELCKYSLHQIILHLLPKYSSESRVGIHEVNGKEVFRHTVLHGAKDKLKA